MHHFSKGFHAGILIALGLAAVIALMIVLVRWARRRGRGAVTTGALLSILAPDPTFEDRIKLVEEAARADAEEDGEGQGKE